MPLFKIHRRRRGGDVEPDEDGMVFPDLHHAYLEACRAIPDTAREMLIAGEDPLAGAFIICDARGRQLLEVPFEEKLSPAEWRRRSTSRVPSVRSANIRDDIALRSFRQMFSRLNVGCVLMTPELEVREMNAFGARHSHVDPEAIRGSSILDVFTDLAGEPKRNFTKFMMLARAGVTSEVIDLPYHVLDDAGETAEGWWCARTWPLFDDDDRLIGLVEWAEPRMSPNAGGTTIVRVAPGLAG